MRLPEGWDIIPLSSNSTPSEQLMQSLEDSGLGFVDIPSVPFDGHLHRLKVEGDKGGEKSGWVVVYGDSLPAGAFGNWRLGVSHTWRADPQRALSPEEEEELSRKYEAAREAREKERLKRQRLASAAVNDIWSHLKDAEDSHPYLIKKRVRNHGLKETADGRLVMPVYINGELTSLQYIDADGEKRFHPGGAISGGYYILKGNPGPAYLVEGYATGATVHEVTGNTVVIGLNAKNLTAVAKAIRDAAPSLDLVVVGDNDASGVGQKAAKEAADAVGARVVIPFEIGDVNDYHIAGGDVTALLAGQKRWLSRFKDFVKHPAPLKWLIKGVLQKSAVHMDFGQPGSGKTFAVLDKAFAVACPEIDNWLGFPIKEHGTVIYLAGEGHHGLKKRLAGLAAYRGVTDFDSVDMYISESAVDLNTTQGINKVIQEIREHDITPALVVIDTVHRFLLGDENKAQDVKTMLDACAYIQRTFDTAVLLVHHTGLGESAQERVRGSSAWKGAMDIETLIAKVPSQSQNINETANQTSFQMLIRQTKNKDSEPLPDTWAEATQIEIPGWLDDEGNQETTMVINPCGTPPEKVSLTPGKRGKSKDNANKLFTRQQAIDAYNQAALDTGKLDDNGEFTGIEESQWRAALYEILEDEGITRPDAKRQAFYRARRSLVDTGEVVEIQETRKIKNRDKIVKVYQFGGVAGPLLMDQIAKKLKERQ